MIIALSWGQLQACRQWGTEQHKLLLSRNRQHSKHGHEVGLPPIGWLTLVEILQRKAFHASGRHRKRPNAREGAVGTRSAVTTIWNVLVEAKQHPALRSEAFLGSRGDVMLAWPVGRREWSLFPGDGEPSILVPEVKVIRMAAGTPAEFQQYVTEWTPRPVGSVDVPGAFLDPAEHLVFVGVVEHDDVASE
jgi:hypothetical protein